ncbi:hypothetical protein [Actinoplanes sp. GCM10030250]|uniref:hypothetical protein n=1 Tax=Actinoplanes sp. GCM10030250 TaxID=3273376 RepID=UPI00360F6030
MTPLLLGGEMPHWSDASPVGGAALRELVGAARGHTLVVGPHDPALIDGIPARHVTVLVRGVPDAEALAARYASRPGIEVCCGSLEKLAAVPAYDTVIALDGLDRTGSTETADMSWAAGFSLLLAVLRPGGRLLLGVSNPVGVHRLLAYASEPGNAEWAAPPEDDPTRPAGPARIGERVREGGSAVLRMYAAYPSPREPRVLLSEGVLEAPGLAGYVSGVLRRAGTSGERMLADPRPVSVQLLRHGLAAGLAPGWVVVAGHGGAVLPEAVVAEGSSVQVLHRASADWIRVAGAGRAGEVVPAGRCLHDLLLAALRGRDMGRVRGLLGAWQGGEFAGVDADAIVVDVEGRLHGLAEPSGPGEAFGRFVRAVGDEGQGHLWPPGETAARPSPEALREVSAAHDRLARELDEARAQASWYEGRLAVRDAELARAYRIIGLLKGTVPGRAATAVRGALRTGKRAARTALNRIHPNH